MQLFRYVTGREQRLLHPVSSLTTRSFLRSSRTTTSRSQLMMLLMRAVPSVQTFRRTSRMLLELLQNSLQTWITISFFTIRNLPRTAVASSWLTWLRRAALRVLYSSCSSSAIRRRWSIRTSRKLSTTQVSRTSSLVLTSR